MVFLCGLRSIKFNAGISIQLEVILKRFSLPSHSLALIDSTASVIHVITRASAENCLDFSLKIRAMAKLIMMIEHSACSRWTVVSSVMDVDLLSSVL